MDVFLSYSRADADHARDLDDWLRAQGLRVFLDTRELVAGQPWLPVLEQAIGRDAKAVAVLVGPRGLGRWQHHEYELAFKRRETEPAFPVIPVLLPGTQPHQAPGGFLGLQSWVSFAEPGTWNDPDARLRLLAGIRGEALDAAAIRAAICPYKGLGAFQEEDQKIFFGRAEEARALHATVLDNRAACVIGRSGTGKSSLARAGLLPLLRRRSAAQGALAWDALVLKPGEAPLEALARVLDPTLHDAQGILDGQRLAAAVEALRGAKPDFVVSLLRQRIERQDRPADRVLILLDQAEEIFACPPQFAGEEATRWRKDADQTLLLLREAARIGPAALVATIRSDFYDPLHRSPLGDLTRHATIPTRGIRDLRSAVEGPANLVGLRFAPGLVDRILRETGEDEDNLPLLQHALEQSWALRKDGVITPEAYDASGGVHLAINKTAQAAYEDLGTARHAAAKRVFLRLVRPGERSGHIRVRAPVPADPAERAVAEFFADYRRRLIFFGDQGGQPVMEVAHEALIRGWSVLLAWVEENRERLAAREAVRDWVRLAGGDLLPEGALLTRARELLADPGDVAVEDVAPVIARSVAAVEATMERARVAARQQRRTRQQRWVVGGLALLAVIGFALGLWVREAEATRQRERDEARAATQLSEERRHGAEALAAAETQRAAAEQRLRAEADQEREEAQRMARLAAVRQSAAEAEAARAEREATEAAAARSRAEAALATARSAANLVFFLAQGDDAEALAAYRAGMVIRERLVADDPANSEWQRDLSISHERIGDVLWTQGDGAGALGAYRAALMIRERLVASDPANAGSQRDLSVSHNKIGDVLRAQGEFVGALAAYRAALAVRERLAGGDPANGGWQRDLSVSHNRIGDALLALGDGPAALAAYRAGMAIAERLAAADPANAGWWRDLFVSHNRIGDVLAAQGDGAGALAAYRAGMAIPERLAVADPVNWDWQRDLLVSHFRLGTVLLATNRPTEARPHAAAALDIAQRRAGQFADQPQPARDVAAAEDLLRRINAAAPP